MLIFEVFLTRTSALGCAYSSLKASILSAMDWCLALCTARSWLVPVSTAELWRPRDRLRPLHTPLRAALGYYSNMNRSLIFAYLNSVKFVLARETMDIVRLVILRSDSRSPPRLGALFLEIRLFFRPLPLLCLFTTRETIILPSHDIFLTFDFFCWLLVVPPLLSSSRSSIVTWLSFSWPEYESKVPIVLKLTYCQPVESIYTVHMDI